MVKRENFYEINENTLKRYYLKVLNKDVEIKTKKFCIFNRFCISRL